MVEFEKYGSWSGGVNLKYQDISKEDYENYFDTELISYETLTSIMDKGATTNEVVSAYYLQEPYKEMIKDAIMEGSTHSLGWFSPDWEFHAHCTLDGSEVNFNDLDETSREHLLNEMLDEGYKSGEICESYTIDVEVSHAITNDGYVSGKVSINNETCSFDYNIETENIDLHQYSNPGWITGACYEVPLSSVISANSAEIIDAIAEAVGDYIEYCGPDFEGSVKSLDSLIQDAEKATQDGKMSEDKQKENEER